MTAAPLPAPIFQDVTGVDPDRFPLVAEHLAIEATDALRAARSSVGALRARKLGGRLWEWATGAGRQRQVVLSQDLLSAQQAALGIVAQVMSEASRTQYSLHRVLINLRDVNHDLDGVTDQVERLDDELARARRDLAARIDAEAARLAAAIADVRREVRREAL